MKILAIGAHYDDIELGCGGTLYKLIQKGHEVHYLSFSNIGNPQITKECQAACAVLGITNLFLYEFQNRIFNSKRQEILDILIKYRDKINPDLVFTQGSTDFHQDHQVIYAESLRAFKFCSLIGYNHPWNTITSKNNLTVSIDRDKKIEALSKYESQKYRPYFNPTNIVSFENFEVIKLNENIICVE